jgi:hypothetical protein
MYTEDYYNEDMDNESDILSQISSSSINTPIKNQLKLIEKEKQLDSGYYKRKVNINGITKKIELYSTPILCNSFIRHAVSGSRCTHRSGSKYEDLYFTVIDTTCPGKDPRHLYYYSPEEYERHQFIKLSPSTKEKWNIRNLRANRLFNN